MERRRVVTLVAASDLDATSPSPVGGCAALAAPAQPGRQRKIHAGQIVVTQVALAIMLAAVGRGPSVGAAAVLAAVVLTTATWLPLRRRWLFEWLATGLRYLTRRRRLGVGAGPQALLELLAPDTRIVPAALPDGTAAVTDGRSLTVLLELGDPAALLRETAQLMPAPATLLPSNGSGRPQVGISLVVSAVAADGADGGAAATSYRQLTERRVLARERVVLAVRVGRPEGWSWDDLTRAASGVVRRIRRRLAPLPARPLAASAALHVLAELAQYDETRPVRESWSMIRLGGLVHASFRLGRWPQEPAAHLMSRLFTLPAAVVTVAITAESAHGAVTTDLTVRLAARDPVALAVAGRGLERLFELDGGWAQRLDGAQLPGLAATLPLGQPVSDRVAGGPADTVEVPIAGLMIGVNRHGDPVAIRLFRPEPTCLVLVGGLPAAQLVVLRALALGARVVVRTVRPSAWEPFLRATGLPGEAISLLPAGGARSDVVGTPLCPRLSVMDVGPVAPDRLSAPGWQTTLVVRDELTRADVDTLARADLALLQPRRPEEAALAGETFGLGSSARWLAEGRRDMVAVVQRRTLRWALLVVTPVERQLIGSVYRR